MKKNEILEAAKAAKLINENQMVAINKLSGEKLTKKLASLEAALKNKVVEPEKVSEPKVEVKPEPKVENPAHELVKKAFIKAGLANVELQFSNSDFVIAKYGASFTYGEDAVKAAIAYVRNAIKAEASLVKIENVPTALSALLYFENINENTLVDIDSKEFQSVLDSLKAATGFGNTRFKREDLTKRQNEANDYFNQFQMFVNGKKVENFLHDPALSNEQILKAISDMIGYIKSQEFLVLLATVATKNLTPEEKENIQKEKALAKSQGEEAKKAKENYPYIFDADFVNGFDLEAEVSVKFKSKSQETQVISWETITVQQLLTNYIVGKGLSACIGRTPKEIELLDNDILKESKFTTDKQISAFEEYDAICNTFGIADVCNMVFASTTIDTTDKGAIALGNYLNVGDKVKIRPQIGKPFIAEITSIEFGTQFVAEGSKKAELLLVTDVLELVL